VIRRSNDGAKRQMGISRYLAALLMSVGNSGPADGLSIVYLMC